MDELFFNNKKEIIESINEWYLSVIKNSTSWQANNLHIDEIETFQNSQRENWLKDSFIAFNILVKEFPSTPLLLNFLHISLSDVNINGKNEKISLKWLEENINDYTPPSLNFTSKDYYNEFYSNQLVRCDFENNDNNDLISNNKFTFYFRTTFDTIESMYNREVYVFSE